MYFFPRKRLRNWLVFPVLGILAGCGEGGQFVNPADVIQKETQTQFVAQQLGVPANRVMLVDLDSGTSYSQTDGVQPLQESQSRPNLPGPDSSGTNTAQPDSISARSLEDEVAQGGVVAFRRVPTQLGTTARPYSEIGATLTLPANDQFDWVDQPGEAYFAYVGVQSGGANTTTLDIGLTTDATNNHTPGRFVGFMNAITAGGQRVYRFLPTLPAAGIEAGASVNLNLRVLNDVDPNQAGAQTGVAFLVLSVTPPFALVASGSEIQGNFRADGVGQSVRFVTSLVSTPGDQDARVAATSWSNVRVGAVNATHAFGAGEVGRGANSPPDPFETREARVRAATPFTAETVDLRPARRVVMVIDDTGSMSEELGAMTAALREFIASDQGDEVSHWGLVTFKDDVTERADTEDRNVIQAAVGSLFASGGGDCPEESLAAINRAVTMLRRDNNGDEKKIILVTDASPRSGSPEATIQNLQNNPDDPIQVDVLLTGDCVSGPVSFRASEPVASSTVSISATLSARVVFKQIAEATGGLFFYMPGAGQADFKAALLEIFENIVTGNNDKEPPVVSLSATPTELWPPNHKMVPIQVTVTAQDNLDPNPTIQLMGVTSSEPDDIQGSGNTEGDIQVNPDGSILLRAERSGTGKRRVYTITYKATDRAGNVGSGSVDIVVPHDKGK